MRSHEARPGDLNLSLEDIASRITECRRCARLRQYCGAVAEAKKREYRDWTYWGRPVPGFGDPQARLLLVGLAPAAHGANRTGRMFTGDSSGAWVYAALHRHGFANQPGSTSATDGLLLHDCYITAAARCAPPDNRPIPHELSNCREYLAEELGHLSRIRVVITLGRIAWESWLKASGA